jgi:hypothetical protein
MEMKFIYSTLDGLEGAFVKVGIPDNWEVCLARDSVRICIRFYICTLPIFEIVFASMNVNLPFTEIEVAVLNHLKIAPSHFSEFKGVWRPRVCSFTSFNLSVKMRRILILKV